jgi:hypothetical protein
LFLEVLVISLISDFFLLDLSDFLDFIVINVEGLSIKGLAIELLSGKGSVIRVLEADEGINSLSVLLEDLHAFDLSVLTEVLLELHISSVGREIFDVKVASLL